MGYQKDSSTVSYALPATLPLTVTNGQVAVAHHDSTNCVTDQAGRLTATWPFVTVRGKVAGSAYETVLLSF